MKTVLTALGLLLSLGAFAHALRIETPATGKVDQAQEIKVFYGEYAEGVDEPFENWYSDVEAFKLFLVAPNGTKTVLETTEGVGLVTAHFTPAEKGTYTLYIAHTAKDLGGKYVYQFNTAAHVAVESTKTTVVLNDGLELQLVLNNISKEIAGTVYFKGKVLADAKVELVSPDLWGKTLKTDAKGRFSVKVSNTGKYFIEASFTEDAAGELNGKPYEKVWRCMTQLVELK